MTDLILSEKDIQLISNLLNNSLQLKILIRKIAPNHNLNEFNQKIIKTILLDLKNEIKELSTSLNINFELNNESIIDLNKIYQGKILSTSKNIAKKLMTLKLDKRNLLTISSPLSIEDFIKINPKISNDNLNNFKRQIEKNWEIIKSLVESNKNSEFYFIEIIDNMANQLIKNELLKYFNINNLKLIILNENDFNAL